MLLTLDAILRDETDARDPRAERRTLFTLGVAAACFYGAAMGLYGLRPLQALYSSIKLPLLLFSGSLVCLPNFFVVNTMLGLRDDFAHALRAVLSAQAVVAIALASFAPMTLFWYASSSSYPFAKLLNGGVFALASLAGQMTIARRYRPLIARDPRHKAGLASWLVLYVFVTVQLAWLLRPFIGRPDTATQFFREGAWGNAYVELYKTLVRFFA